MATWKSIRALPDSLVATLVCLAHSAAAIQASAKARSCVIEFGRAASIASELHLCARPSCVSDYQPERKVLRRGRDGARDLDCGSELARSCQVGSNSWE